MQMQTSDDAVRVDALRYQAEQVWRTITVPPTTARRPMLGYPYLPGMATAIGAELQGLAAEHPAAAELLREMQLYVSAFTLRYWPPGLHDVAIAETRPLVDALFDDDESPDLLLVAIHALQTWDGTSPPSAAILAARRVNPRAFGDKVRALFKLPTSNPTRRKFDKWLAERPKPTRELIASYYGKGSKELKVGGSKRQAMLSAVRPDLEAFLRSIG